MHGERTRARAGEDPRGAGRLGSQGVGRVASSQFQPWLRLELPQTSTDGARAERPVAAAAQVSGAVRALEPEVAAVDGRRLLGGVTELSGPQRRPLSPGLAVCRQDTDAAAANRGVDVHQRPPGDPRVGGVHRPGEAGVPPVRLLRAVRRAPHGPRQAPAQSHPRGGPGHPRDPPAPRHRHGVVPHGPHDEPEARHLHRQRRALTTAALSPGTRGRHRSVRLRMRETLTFSVSGECAAWMEVTYCHTAFIF